jgi:hypothetical protein
MVCLYRNQVPPLTTRQRLAVLVGVFIATVAGLLFIDPIPQDAAYHLFADARSVSGIPNYGDVASNVPLALVGGFGLWFVLRSQGAHLFDHPAERLPFVVFFIGLVLLSVGSAYYHLAPDNDRLFWDRLPITIVFMALTSAFVADRIHGKIGALWVLPILVGAGILSVVYWDWSESLGNGDLRFYGLVQFYPMVALPMICWLFPKARLTGSRYLAWMIAWYALAKVFEHLDGEIFELSANTVSGHSLKQLAAAVMALVVVRMLAASRSAAGAVDSAAR